MAGKILPRASTQGMGSYTYWYLCLYCAKPFWIGVKPRVHNNVEVQL